MTQPGERERLANWLRDCAKQSDCGRKADPKDKRRRAAALLESDGVELARLQAKSDSQAAELKHKDAELEALRKDAERYRWLRANLLKVITSIRRYSRSGTDTARCIAVSA